jgi:hypothetical protein
MDSAPWLVTPAASASWMPARRAMVQAPGGAAAAGRGMALGAGGD